MTASNDLAAAPRASADDFGALLAATRARIDERLGEWLRPRVAAATQISEEVGTVAAAVQELALRGGKRMRAALVAAAFEAWSTDAHRGPGAGAATWSPCEPAMMAVELLQTYLLIHDDWMDDDDVRRGGPAVHVLLREKLGARALGDAAGILAGDLASGYAQEALLETDLPVERVVRAARAFARIQVEVVTGQLAEMRAAGRAAGAAGLPSVETIHALKTASYTVTGPLLLGAALAGADDARAAELERFGRPLGIAFQLRDDLLGVFGDPSATGKPVWNDIRQGKRTALVAELRGDARASELLGRVFGKPDAAEADLEAVVRAMEDSGARGRVEARVRELSSEARAALDAMAPSMSDRGRAWLGGAVAALGERSA
ncbi:MAG: polyprenyl synthetase family protein [Labilithrix sp.]|nr:polyprenyl synthetase family protein [Labilithrix sp.]MBX3224777.1 polyprenyl synthetase family protein [Labilithrix sp.]